MNIVTTVLCWVALLAFPAFLGFIASHVRNTSLRDTLNAAASRAGGIAYAILQQQFTSGAQPSIPRAIDVGVDHLRNALPDTIQSLGISSDILTNVVRGELGKLLAVDPNTVAVAVPKPTLP